MFRVGTAKGQNLDSGTLFGDDLMSCVWALPRDKTLTVAPDSGRLFCLGDKMDDVQQVEFRKKCKRYNIPNNAHQLTFSCFKRRPFLNDMIICEKLAECLSNACVRHEFALWAYVFMPEHVHLLVCPRKHEYSISKFLSAIKQPLSRWIIKYHRVNNTDFLEQMTTGQKCQSYRFWQAGGGYDRNIYKRQTAFEKIRYIHLNPVRRKLVQFPEDWLYSSYKDWNTGEKGPIEVDKKSFWC